MRYGKTVVMAAAVAFAVGCGKVDPFADATPDFDGVALEIQGGAAEGINQALQAPELAQSSSALTASEYFGAARTAVGQLNGALLKVLNGLDYVVTHVEPSTSTADLRVYGPKDTANATFLLTIKKLADGRFGWKLEARPLASPVDTPYVVVMAGSITKGDLPHRGHGVLGADLDAYKTVDGTFNGQGKLLCGFAHVADSKAVAYRLVGFTPDAAAHDPVNARFVGYRKADTGFTAARLMSLTNVTGTSALETVLSRVRYLPTVGGRLDFVAFGGDIALDRLYWGTACIDPASGEVFKRLQACPRPLVAGSCTVVSSSGDIGACPGQADQTPPSDDPNDGTMESGAPTGTDTVTAPDTFPTVDGQ